MWCGYLCAGMMHYTTNSAGLFSLVFRPAEFHREVHHIIFLWFGSGELWRAMANPSRILSHLGMEPA